jgi:hypothetical protein
MRSQQQAKKQTEEKALGYNPENLQQSMDKRAFLGQNNISPVSEKLVPSAFREYRFSGIL